MKFPIIFFYPFEFFPATADFIELGPCDITDLLCMQTIIKITPNILCIQTVFLLKSVVYLHFLYTQIIRWTEHPFV